MLLITGGSTAVVLGVMLFGFWSIWQDLSRLEQRVMAPVAVVGQAVAPAQPHALTAMRREVSGVISGMRRGILGTMAALGVAVIIAFVWFELVLRHAVLRPARRLVKDLSRMAEGDFSRPVTVTTHDEIGRVARSAADVRMRLASVLGGLHQATDQVAVAASELQSVAKAADQGAARQQGETAAMAEAMEGMALSVQRVARHTAEAAEAAEQADREADSGRDIFGHTSAAIRGLADEVERASAVIRRLHAKSEEIGAVLDVIRGIAEQTNLLALNAAIEAARAGSQGRGFAVVADEVRTLASRTQASTAEIRTMIEQLQAGAEDAVAVMAQGHRQASDTVEQAGEAERALGVINQAVARIAELSREIARAAEEQSGVVETVSVRVESISAASETAAAGATQTLSASADLSALSEGVRREVGRFRLPAAG